jgi:hypothetical protein
MDADDAPGKYRLISEPLHAVGVAKVTREIRNRIGVIRSDESTEIVALELCSDGTWYVCEEASNYAGMCPVGEDISAVTSNLGGDYLNNLIHGEAPQS